MSATYVYNGAQNWNFLGRFYGIDPGVLAAYNGKTDADLAAPVAKGFRLRIPNAAELVAFYPEFQKLFPASHDSFGLALRAPTVVRMGRTYEGPDGELSAYTKPRRDFIAVPWVPKDGNLTIVTAARMRKNSHAGENYEAPNAIRSPNPGFQPTNLPDVTTHAGLKNVWKCNMLVGDILYAAGYDWPMSEFHRYFGPDGLMQALTVPNIYALPVWVSSAFKNGQRIKDAPDDEPTAEDFRDVLPGDVMLLHGYGSLPHHSAIVTSRPMKNPRDGEIYVRTLDIYGERWYPIASEGITAILRPRKRLPMPAMSVAGDPNQAERILDHQEDEEVSGEPVDSPLYQTVEP